MASIGISASMHRACTSQHITNKQSTQPRPETKKHATNIVNVEALKLSDQKQENSKFINSDNNPKDERVEQSNPRFCDTRWRNGTWDLNMFVKNGRMDWDSVIEAEAKRRKFLEMYPEASSNDEPVLFRSSIIPWWAWIVHSHLPEAELLNGRAAMIGFFMAYLVDALTGLNVVGQTGNFLCKGALLFTIIGVLVFRKKEDVENIQKLVDEATFYDKQWQSSWQNQDSSNVQKSKNI